MRVAGIQFTGDINKENNLANASRLVQQAVENGAKIVCLQEMFNSIYPCFEPKYEYYDLAEPIPGPTIDRMAELALQHGIVLIAPIYEIAIKGEYYNTAVVINADGKIIGKYRKSHLPLVYLPDHDLIINEKFYFKPGNTGFQVFPTPFGVNVGIVICADRHYPEGLRILGVKGADIVFIPSAFSSKQTLSVWEAELKAAAIANIYYVVGINRVGLDVGGFAKPWMGSSMIVNPRGEVIARAGSEKEEILYTDLDLALISQVRNVWGFYRDRRPDLYGELTR